MQQFKEDYDRRDTHRKALIERAMSHFSGKLTVEMRPYPRRFQPPFPHSREISLWLQNNKIYRIVFDKGMDFLLNNTDGMYRVTELTYILITNEEPG